MAINLYTLGFIIKGIDQLTGPLRNMTVAVEKLNEAGKAQAPLREAAGTMAKIGFGSLAAGGAIAYGLSKLIGPAVEAQAEMAHVATAMDDGVQTAQHLKEVHENRE